MIPNGYVAIVADEPIGGLPSYRLYGPFVTREAAHLALSDAGLTNGGVTHPELHSTGVLPLRPIDSLPEEATYLSRG